MVLAEVEPGEDVGVPRLEVHGERALALAAALVNVAGGVVEDAEHRHDAVRGAVRAADVRVGRADVVHGDADAARVLGDGGARLEGVVDALDRVLLHGQKEAARHLRARGARVEEGRGRVGEELLAHESVGLDGRVHILLVDANGNTHEHVLRALRDLAIDLEEVRALKSFEAEVIKLEVAVVDDGRVEALLVLHDYVEHILRDERRRLAGLRVDVGAQALDVLRERLLGLLVQVRDRDARGKDREVRVLGGHVRGGLRGKLVELNGGDARVDALDHLEGDGRRVHILGREAVAELLDARRDLVEQHRLLLSATLDDEHGGASRVLC
mmetsp:Transcript_58906/g.162848  ORF Transcript_58906/g.162848 Transcript_58906/m.162848 type:complete len:327 (-) Transcript_58906:3-983(-)